MVKPKLTFKEKRELDTLEKEIGDLVSEKEQLSVKLGDGSNNFESIQKISGRLVEVTALIQEKELRWLTLSEMAESRV